MNKTEEARRVSLASMLIAIAVVGSLFSFPILGSRSAPIQHLVNLLAAILLGPGYALGIAFGASLLRNLLGWGTLLAFPGSMFGALLAGLFYRYSKKSFTCFYWRSIRDFNFWRFSCLFSSGMDGNNGCRFNSLYCSVFSFNICRKCLSSDYLQSTR